MTMMAPSGFGGGGGAAWGGHVPSPWVPWSFHQGAWVNTPYGAAMSGQTLGPVPGPSWWLDGGWCGSPWGGAVWGNPYCPQIWVGGACCEECAADGGSCAGAKTAMAVTSVGQTRALPFSKATELNTEIIKLSQDVGQWAVSKIGTFEPNESAAALAAKFPNPTEGDFFLAFRQFKADWDAFYNWRLANPPPWYVPAPSFAMTEVYGDLPKYDALLARYEPLLAQFVTLGGKTQSKVPSQESAFEEGVKGAGEGLGKAAATVVEVGTWALLLAAGGALLYFAGPPIASALMKRRTA